MMQLGVSDVLFKHVTGFFHYVYSVVTTSQKSAGVSETINHGDFFFGMIIGTTTLRYPKHTYFCFGLFHMRK